MRDAGAAADLTMRDYLLSCVLGFALAVTPAAAAEPGPNAETAQSPGATSATGASGDLVKRLQRKPIAEKPTRDLFGSATWQPPPKPAAPPPPPPPPMAPPLPYIFMGKMTQSGHADIIFLTKARGDEVYTVSARGDVLEGIYRVDEVAAGHIALTYLPLNIKQILSFAEGAVGPRAGIVPSQPGEIPVPIPTRDVISTAPASPNPPSVAQMPTSSPAEQPVADGPAPPQ